MGVIVTSSRPPGSTDDAEKDLTALCEVASTGAGCNSPTSHRADTATANNANAFVTIALPCFCPLLGSTPQALSNQPAK